MILASTLTCKKAQVQVTSQLLTFITDCTIIDHCNPLFMGFTCPLFIGWDLVLSSLMISLFTSFPIALPFLSSASLTVHEGNTCIADTPMQEDFDLIKVSCDQVESKHEFNMIVERAKTTKETRGLKHPSEEAMPELVPCAHVKGAQAFLDFLDNVSGTSIHQYYAHYSKFWGIVHVSSLFAFNFCQLLITCSVCHVMMRPPALSCRLARPAFTAV